jgi:aspartyl-tRNA(Asn)/glutamyl-tRNA(Gln) amidotransferase subunit C
LRITEEEVKRVAELANLALSEHELARMTEDISGILTYIDKLNELDTSGVAPMAQVLFEQEETATLRADEERAPLSNTDAVGNAALAGLGYFKVPKVIER